MKVLILSCKTGGGHDAAGLAVKEELEAEGHEAVLFDYLILAGQKVSQTVGDVYVNTVKKAPHIFGAVYKLGMAVSRITRKSPVYYVNAKMGKYLQAYLEEESFDAIVMPHLYPAETLTYMKRQGMALPPLAAVMTDYTCIPFWEETRCDYYIAPHKDLIPGCVKRGIPREKLLPYGIPVSRRFRKKADKESARDYLGLPKDRKIFLLAGGSMGAGDLEKLCRRLWEQIREFGTIVVICGGNKKIFLKMKKEFAGQPQIYIVGQTKQMDLYMKACDILYTKPGGLTSTEAAVSGIPIVHTDPIPGCETSNRKFFAKRGMSLAPRTLERQIRQGIALLASPEKCAEMREAQQRNIPGDSAVQIVRLLEQVCAERKSEEGSDEALEVKRIK